MTSLASGARPRLRRDRAGGWIAGVCSGLARRLGADPALVRLAFVVATAAGGLGVALYALAWLVVPAGDSPAGERRRPSSARASVQVAVGSGLLLLSALLTFRALGLWFSDAIVWPLVLIADRRRADLAPVARSAGRTRGPDPPASAAHGAGTGRAGHPRPCRGGTHRGRGGLAHRRGRGPRDRRRLRLPPGHRRARAPPGTCCSRCSPWSWCSA